MKKKITDILDSLDAFRVQQFSINSPESSISLDFTSIDDKISVQFKDVLSYLFINDNTVIDTKPINNKSLNKIAYYEGGVFQLASTYHLDEDELEQNSCYPNFVIDLDNSCLLIEAGQIDIDGESILL